MTFQMGLEHTMTVIMALGFWEEMRVQFPDPGKRALWLLISLSITVAMDKYLF
jgi:hypothetical protein